MKEDEQKYKEFLNEFAANIQRLKKVGIKPFGFDPGYLVNVDGCYGGINLPTKIVEIICDLVKKVYPETVDDEKMIKEYKEEALKRNKRRIINNE